MIDEANSEALRMIEETLPPSSELLVNLQVPGEYVDEIALHLAYLWGRPDIRVDYVRPGELVERSTGEDPVYLLESIVGNQPLMTSRMGAIEPSVREWNRQLEEFVGESGVLEGRVERAIRLHNVNLVRLLCPLIPTRGFCEVDEPLLDLRVFTYGWELYRIGDAGLEGREGGPRPAAAREAAQWR
jgi:hypothetical protein